MTKFVLIIFGVAIFAIPASAQKAVVPIVESKIGGLMGGVQNGKWLAPAKVFPTMRDETEFVLVSWNGVEEGAVTLGKKAEQEDVCPDFKRIELESGREYGIAIGSQGHSAWNPAPRVPRAIDLNNAAYKTVVTRFLKKKGIVRPVVKITEAFRVDLEGDGVDEVLLAATYYKNGLSASAAVGDYSLVILRKAAGKAVTDHLLQGEFILKKVTFGAPSEHHISAIADLNGDGGMEIVLYGSYYEGEFASAFEMKNGRPVKIKEFEIGCGV